MSYIDLSIGLLESRHDRVVGFPQASEPKRESKREITMPFMFYYWTSHTITLATFYFLGGSH